jgi:hypothetical protein
MGKNNKLIIIKKNRRKRENKEKSKLGPGHSSKVGLIVIHHPSMVTQNIHVEYISQEHGKQL